MNSPYSTIPQDQWKTVTQHLIEEHPLKLEVIREIALECWSLLWKTKIGEGSTIINLYELDLPAQVVGYFFEKLFAKKLQGRDTNWRGGDKKDEKDLVYIPDPHFSVEMKSSGQLGTKIFGNRSYGIGDADSKSKKEKSGYYMTINFYEKSLNLLRFGWIDYSDWKAQKSETGQASGLDPDVYTYKLIEIPGDYRLDAPVGLLEGIGKKIAQTFSDEQVVTIRDLIGYQGTNKKIIKFREKLEELQIL